MTAYLTGVSTAESRSAHRSDLGLLTSIDNSVHRQLGQYAPRAPWGADNGQYTASKKGIAFDAARAELWRAWLASHERRDAAFVTLPDVLEWHEVDGALIPIGNLDATLELSSKHLDSVLELGFTPALVLQDGMTSLEEFPRWRELGAVFVGGSDEFKAGPEVERLVASANARGLWTHVGRVNSWRRFARCIALGADSADGTFLKFGRRGENWPRLEGWLDRQSREASIARLAAAA